MSNNNEITFSFGKNWQNLLKVINEDDFARSKKDLDRWFSNRVDLKGKEIIDIGSGSGIHSLMLYSMNPKKLYSFDFDKHSVAATKSLWEKSGSPNDWQVNHGSVLDKKYLLGLGKFDLVYSWGVLHHTGNMWEAIENASEMVKPNGYFLLAIYQGVKTYEYDLDLKKKYNKTGYLGKKGLEFSKFIWPLMKNRIKWRENPFKWNKKVGRGMDTYHDIVDWLGGLPYEVASDEQIQSFLKPFGFKLIEKDMNESCGTYLLQKVVS